MAFMKSIRLLILTQVVWSKDISKNTLSPQIIGNSNYSANRSTLQFDVMSQNINSLPSKSKTSSEVV